MRMGGEAPVDNLLGELLYLTFVLRVIRLGRPQPVNSS